MTAKCQWFSRNNSMFQWVCEGLKILRLHQISQINHVNWTQLLKMQLKKTRKWVSPWIWIRKLTVLDQLQRVFFLGRMSEDSYHLKTNSKKQNKKQSIAVIKLKRNAVITCKLSKTINQQIHRILFASPNKNKPIKTNYTQHLCLGCSLDLWQMT